MILLDVLQSDDNHTGIRGGRTSLNLAHDQHVIVVGLIAPHYVADEIGPCSQVVATPAVVPFADRELRSILIPLENAAHKDLPKVSALRGYLIRKNVGLKQVSGGDVILFCQSDKVVPVDVAPDQYLCKTPGDACRRSLVQKRKSYAAVLQQAFQFNVSPCQTSRNIVHRMAPLLYSYALLAIVAFALRHSIGACRIILSSCYFARTEGTTVVPITTRVPSKVMITGSRSGGTRARTFTQSPFVATSFGQVP